MENRQEFLKKLGGLVDLAKGNGNKITIDEVKKYFVGTELNDEQMDLVFDYLLTQKIVVQGYFKMPEETPQEEITYTEEEQAYLDEYMEDLKAFKPAQEGEKEVLFSRLVKGDHTAKTRLSELYLGQVVELAKEYYCEEIFLGDLIQEGNMGLILALEEITDADKAHGQVLGYIRRQMHMLIEETTELSTRDKKMVEKVNQLDAGIKALTEEMGRKVSIDELALYMGMTEDEIEDILRLMGEDSEEEMEEES
jgi:DNA-directed RNA polymerase sigma subunit (sigma70/sigma32)